MEQSRQPRVTLTGDVAGDYVILEKRPDGTLVVAPDTSKRSAGVARRATSRGGTLLSGLLGPAKTPLSDVEVLEDWGVELGAHELVSEFFIANVDDTMGFLAITSRRFIFVTDAGKRQTVVHEHMLSAARNVEFVRRGLRHKLRVTWHGVDSFIDTPDRKALTRLQHYLEGHA
jgi:hypothetical protein